MKPDKLTAMANQIAGYFQSYPDDRAVAGIRTHIEKFWTPRMREAFHARIEADATGVHPLVVAAMGTREAVAV